jgi:hypothetical protein
MSDAKGLIFIVLAFFSCGRNQFKFFHLISAAKVQLFLIYSTIYQKKFFKT